MEIKSTCSQSGSSDPCLRTVAACQRTTVSHKRVIEPEGVGQEPQPHNLLQGSPGSHKLNIPRFLERLRNLMADFNHLSPEHGRSLL